MERTWPACCKYPGGYVTAVTGTLTPVIAPECLRQLRLLPSPSRCKVEIRFTSSAWSQNRGGDSQLSAQSPVLVVACMQATFKRMHVGFRSIGPLLNSFDFKSI